MQHEQTQQEEKEKEHTKYSCGDEELDLPELEEKNGPTNTKIKPMGNNNKPYYNPEQKHKQKTIQ